jgi:hypothetical protein
MAQKDAFPYHLLLQRLADVVHAVRERNRPFLEFSLCLSRACLGKCSIFSGIEWRKKTLCSPQASAFEKLAQAACIH